MATVEANQNTFQVLFKRLCNKTGKILFDHIYKYCEESWK